MQIVTVEEIRRLEQESFEHLGLSARLVMECAGRCVADCIEQKLQHCRTVAPEVLVLCGKGNNGGDGYVAARTLKNRGYAVRVIATHVPAQLSGDAAASFFAWHQSGGDTQCLSEDQSQDFESSASVIVDGVFGTGFRGEIEGPIARLFYAINHREQRVPVVAIDIASGVEADTGRAAQESLIATETVALHHLKWGHVLFPGALHAGEVVLAEIGLWGGRSALSLSELLTEKEAGEVIGSFYPLGPEAHKGSRGHVLVVGGSTGFFGAPRLAAEAALLAGAGLVTVGMPESAAVHRLKEVMTLPLPQVRGKKGFSLSSAGVSVVQEFLLGGARQRSLVLGPGMGTSQEAGEFLEGSLRFINECQGAGQVPLVLDADALNILAARRELFSLLPPHSVLTPHPGEMSRLLQEETEVVQSDRVGHAVRLSTETGCMVVLKGARSVIASPAGAVWVSPAVAECLATAGSGDVLSGVIGAFLARGATPESALLAAVFVHGRAGESLRGPAGVTASTVMRQIPKEINTLLGGGALAARGGERGRPRGVTGSGLKTVLRRVR